MPGKLGPDNGDLCIPSPVRGHVSCITQEALDSQFHSKHLHGVSEERLIDHTRTLAPEKERKGEFQTLLKRIRFLQVVYKIHRNAKDGVMSGSSGARFSCRKKHAAGSHAARFLASVPRNQPAASLGFKWPEGLLLLANLSHALGRLTQIRLDIF